MSKSDQIKTVKTSKGNVEYTERGEGYPIICIHGAMGGHDQSEILGRTVGPEGFRYIAISRPGYLGSSIDLGKTPEEQADLLAEFLDELKIKKAIIMAISGGGYSAITFATRHKERCRALLLFSTTGGPNNEKIPFAFNIMVLLAKIPPLVRLLQKVTEKNIEKNLKQSITNDEIYRRTVGNSEVMALFRELSVGMFNNMNKRVSGTKNDIFQTKTREYPLDKISIPVLVVHGEADKIVPFKKHGKRLAAEIPGSKLLKVPEGEHVTIFTHRDLVQKEVSLFLNSLK